METESTSDRDPELADPDAVPPLPRASVTLQAHIKGFPALLFHRLVGALQDVPGGTRPHGGGRSRVGHQFDSGAIQRSASA